MSNLLVVEINDENIKIMEGSRRGNTLNICKWVSVNVPLNIIEDGKILNQDIINEILEKALIVNLFKTKQAVFIINSNSVITRKIELPYLKSNKQTKSMITFKLQEIMSVDLNQYKIIYNRTLIFLSEGIKKSKFIVYGMPIEIYNQYVELAEKLKLNITYLNIASNLFDKISKSSLIINNKQSDINYRIAYVNVGYNRITLSIINNGITELFRNFYMNNNPTKYLERVAETETDYYNQRDKPSKHTDNMWIGEMRKYLRYYYSLNKENILEKIYLYGENTSLMLNSEMYFDFNVDFEKIEEVSNVNIDATTTEKLELNKYFNLLLAFYCSKSDINFLKDMHEHHKYRFRKGVALMSSALILVITLAFYTLDYFININRMENEIAIMNMFVSNKENINNSNEIENLKNHVYSLEKYYEKAAYIKEKTTKQDIISSKIFEEIKAATPSDTIINSIYVHRNSIEMQCNSKTLKSVAAFINNIRSIDFVSSVYMPSVAIENTEEIKSYSYGLTCKLKGE